MSRCVVCGGPITEPQFANAWEKARKLYPCCSDACAKRFDPDVHWLPAERPQLLDGPEEARMLDTARQRIREGDRPSLVVRDMLVAGVGTAGVRKLIVDGELAAAAGDRTARTLNILGGIRALFGGGLRFAQRRDKQDPVLLRAASADIDAWRARFEAQP